MEKAEATKSLGRVDKLLFLEVDRLSMIAKDWSEWDDTHFSVKGNNLDYPDVNPNAAILSNANVNMIMLFNSSNQLSYVEGVDLDSGGSVKVPSYLVDFISSQNKLNIYSNSNKTVSGIINSPEGLLLIASHRTTKNSQNGTLIILRFLDSEFVKQLEDTSDLSIEISPLDKSTFSNEINSTVSSTNSISINRFDEDFVIASTLLDDVYGNPVLYLDVKVPRDTYHQGISTAKYLYNIILLIALTYSIVLLIAIEKSVISRLSKLNSSINAIALKGGLSSRVRIDGNDEISNLGNKINEMLKSLEDEENLFETTLESNDEGIIVIDTTKKVLVINSKFIEMLDLPSNIVSEKNGKKLLSYILSQTTNSDEVCLKIKSLLDTSDSNRDILHFKNAYYYEWYSSPFVKNGIICGRVFCLHDISEIKKIEHSLREANIATETANRTKSEFLANMSHELRTPLNSVIGFSDVLLEENCGFLNEKQKRYIKNISKSGKHLLNIINDILDISKVESGKMQLHKQNTSAKALIEDMLASMQSLAAKKEIVLRMYIDDDFMEMDIDRGKIKQVLYNLIGNAIKFTDCGGFVTICAKIDANMVEISVKDTGIGISKADQHKLFKPFSQIDSSISRKYEGTGLGLVLAKEIINLHGGQIWLESEIGKGTTFIFTIPLNKPLTNRDS
ncbi:MAG: ATP-binding protein [Methanomethylovorans sp.]|uniref:ATP-binding protein n=1 Tax=Methanomethylovorans sp. TaxID=2758717 RepID=UPI003530D696